MSALAGECRIGGRGVPGGGEAFQAIDPRSGAPLAPVYRDASGAQLADACAHAAAAAEPYAAMAAAQRARFLRAIGERLLAIGEPLVARVMAETALPRPRVEGERARTIGQLQLFAALLDEGSWVDARIDTAQPARQPQPKPDLRRMLFPLGPVAVFGASNFPLAYSVAGGDTASALAAGCPVVVKAHPAHPGSSELVAQVIDAAAEQCGVPAGAFALVHGRVHAVGAQLVQHPALTAVGFTGSPQGGRALFDLCALRPTPIPVFAEMGSANPVFVLPEALAQRGAAVAAALAASSMLAVGQMCTSPGIALCLDGAPAALFVAALQAQFAGAPAGTMVHPSIADGHARAVAEVRGLAGVQPLAQGPDGGTGAVARPQLFEASAAALLQQPRLRHEIFGPAMLAVRCRHREELLAIARALDGHLTATVHGTAADLRAFADLLAILRQKAGRLICNGVPTGVEVCAAMQHGGPYPASTDARSTSVGTAAILRWVRPVCFQDVPQELLPPELHDGNPRGIWRIVDGALGRH